MVKLKPEPPRRAVSGSSFGSLIGGAITLGDVGEMLRRRALLAFLSVVNAMSSSRGGRLPVSVSPL